MYRVRITSKANKEINRLGGSYKISISKIIAALELESWPENLDIKQIEGVPGKKYRVRVRDIRILFEVNNSIKELIVFKVGFRGGVY